MGEHKNNSFLSLERVEELIKYAKQNDGPAMEKLIDNYIRLIVFIAKKYANYGGDFEELICEGRIGLIEAIYSFDESKTGKFSNYASVCIENQILMYLRKYNRRREISLDTVIAIDEHDRPLTPADLLSDETDIENEHIDKELKNFIRSFINGLPTIDKEISMLHYGFYGKVYSQKDIAEMYNMTPLQVSTKIRSIRKELANKLNEMGFFNLTPKKIYRKSKMVQSIYDFFDGYSKELVNEMLRKLSDEEMKLIIFRYGSDLENPIFNPKWTKEHNKQFFNVLVPEMRKILIELKTSQDILDNEIDLKRI